MEKPSFVRDGVWRLPPGFRFHPTDEELVVQYLRRKALSFPLPASIIPEIDLGRYNPWDLPGFGAGGGSKEDRYFFNLREAKYPNGSRSNRATGAGYWKATGKDKAVVFSRSNQVVGMKKVLVFYQGKPPNGSRTDWIMHEYRLPSSPLNNIIISSPPPLHKRNSGHNTDAPRRDWVLCRIFKKKRATQTDGEEDDDARIQNGGIRFFDFMRERNAYGRPAQSSSCVTEVSDGCNSGEETSSGCMNRSSPS